MCLYIPSTITPMILPYHLNQNYTKDYTFKNFKIGDIKVSNLIVDQLDFKLTYSFSNGFDLSYLNSNITFDWSYNVVLIGDDYGNATINIVSFNLNEDRDPNGSKGAVDMSGKDIGGRDISGNKNGNNDKELADKNMVNDGDKTGVNKNTDDSGDKSKSQQNTNIKINSLNINSHSRNSHSYESIYKIVDNTANSILQQKFETYRTLSNKLFLIFIILAFLLNTITYFNLCKKCTK